MSRPTSCDHGLVIYPCMTFSAAIYPHSPCPSHSSAASLPCRLCIWRSLAPVTFSLRLPCPTSFSCPSIALLPYFLCICGFSAPSEHLFEALRLFICVSLSLLVIDMRLPCIIAYTSAASPHHWLIICCFLNQATIYLRLPCPIGHLSAAPLLHWLSICGFLSPSNHSSQALRQPCPIDHSYAVSLRNWLCICGFLAPVIIYLTLSCPIVHTCAALLPYWLCICDFLVSSDHLYEALQLFLHAPLAPLVTHMRLLCLIGYSSEVSLPPATIYLSFPISNHHISAAPLPYWLCICGFLAPATSLVMHL